MTALDSDSNDTGDAACAVRFGSGKTEARESWQDHGIASAPCGVGFHTCLRPRLCRRMLRCAWHGASGGAPRPSCQCGTKLSRGNAKKRAR